MNRQCRDCSTPIDRPNTTRCVPCAHIRKMTRRRNREHDRRQRVSLLTERLAYLLDCEQNGTRPTPCR